mmetsp:Transcript_4775/g.11353  ORF Transcript_4775/g.11353 Transcript_4775/m.11353 type:complete len:131 (+) Transcript_4775:777-1169(+)
MLWTKFIHAFDMRNICCRYAQMACGEDIAWSCEGKRLKLHVQSRKNVSRPLLVRRKTRKKVSLLQVQNRKKPKIQVKQPPVLTLLNMRKSMQVKVGSPVSALKMTQLTCHMLVKSLAAECITVCALHFAM